MTVMMLLTVMKMTISITNHEDKDKLLDVKFSDL